MSAMDTIDRSNERYVRSMEMDGGRRKVGFFASIARGLVRLGNLFEKRRSRRMLFDLTDTQLKDIGITRADAHGEATRRFWD